jgi:putative hydrolase of the HAD superfamily
MVEDSLDNLLTAKKLGMKTVWVSRESRRPVHVDYRVRKIRELKRLHLA